MPNRIEYVCVFLSLIALHEPTLVAREGNGDRRPTCVEFSVRFSVDLAPAVQSGSQGRTIWIIDALQEPDESFMDELFKV